MEVVSGIQWLLVGAGVLAAFLLSFLWYAVLFQKPWMRALGIRLEDVHELQMAKFAPYVTALISYVVLGVVTSVLVQWMDLRGLGAGLLLGALTFVGFNLTAFARLVFFEDRPLALLWIDGGADLLTHLIFGGLLTTWR
jgi:hypothetical protein